MKMNITIDLCTENMKIHLFIQYLCKNLEMGCYSYKNSHNLYKSDNEILPTDHLNTTIASWT